MPSLVCAMLGICERLRLRWCSVRVCRSELRGVNNVKYLRLLGTLIAPPLISLSAHLLFT